MREEILTSELLTADEMLLYLQHVKSHNILHALQKNNTVNDVDEHGQICSDCSCIKQPLR